MSAKRVLSIDPGSAKCGVAVVDSDNKILLQDVVSTEELPAEAARLVALYEPIALVMGNGTGSRPIADRIRALALSPPLLLVPEAHTTIQARERYLDAHPPKGWLRLVPRALRTPPVPIDDFVAVILAERYWKEKG